MKSKSLAEHNEWVLSTPSNKRSIHPNWEIGCPNCDNPLKLGTRIKMEPKQDHMSKDGECEKCDLVWEVLV